MGFKDIIIGVVLAGLFALSLLTFGINLATENNSANSIVNESIILPFNETLHDNLEAVKSTSESQRNSLENQEAQGGDEGFSLTTIPTILFNFTSLMFGTFQILIHSISQVLGIHPIVINVIVASLVITIVILTWRVIKAGGT